MAQCLLNTCYSLALCQAPGTTDTVSHPGNFQVAGGGGEVGGKEIGKHGTDNKGQEEWGEHPSIGRGG